MGHSPSKNCVDKELQNCLIAKNLKGISSYIPSVVSVHLWVGMTEDVVSCYEYHYYDEHLLGLAIHELLAP